MRIDLLAEVLMTGINAVLRMDSRPTVYPSNNRWTAYDWWSVYLNAEGPTAAVYVTIDTRSLTVIARALVEGLGR